MSMSWYRFERDAATEKVSLEAAPAGFQYHDVGPSTALDTAPAIALARAPTPISRKFAPRVPCFVGGFSSLGCMPPGSVCCAARPVAAAAQSAAALRRVLMRFM